MSPLTCTRVEGFIDLYAAGECDAPTRAAVDRHLTDCAACREALGKAQQLMGLLDQRLQEPERLQRLWSRLESEPGRVRRPTQNLPWRAAAVAAAVLVTLGLSGWFRPVKPPSSDGVQLTAILNLAEARFAPAPAVLNDNPVKVMKETAVSLSDAARVYKVSLHLQGKTPAAFRNEVRAAAGTNRLPPPPAVDIAVAIHNATRDVLTLPLGDERTELTLDLQGPGVIDVPAPNAAPPVPNWGMVCLAPGETLRLPIRRLAYGRRNAVRYVYWTEPGEYTLTITLRVPVEANPLAGAREMATATGPIQIRVGEER